MPNEKLTRWLNGVKNLHEAATEGPWVAIHHEKASLGHWVQTKERIRKNDPGKYPPDFAEQILADEDYPTKAADADLIARARTLVPQMEQLIRLLMEEREACHGGGSDGPRRFLAAESALDAKLKEILG